MRTTSTAAAVLTTLVLAVSGCSTGGDRADDASTTAASGPDTTATPSTAPSSTAPSSTSADAVVPDPGELVEGIAIADDDLLDGETHQLREQGAQVVNQVTLDYCGYTFTTEAERLSRHQVNVYRGEEYVASNEAVLYAPGSAEDAMNQVRQAISECPPGVAVPSVIADVPDLIYAAEPIPADQLGGLTEDHIAVDVTASTPDGESQSVTLIYQRRGDVLVGSYGDHDRALQLADAVAQRLAAAPASDVGA